MTDRSPLAYSSAPPPWHRRRWVRPVIVLSLIALAAILLRPVVTERATIIYWQHRMDSDVAPAGTRLVSTGTPTTIPYGSLTTTTRAQLPIAWAKAVDLLLPRGSPDILYAGGRTDSAGKRRLVIVREAGSFAWSPPPGVVLQGERTLALRAFALIPGSCGEPPAKTAAVDTALGLGIPSASTDIMAGQPTPNDLSRISIEVRSTGGSVWIDGQLLPDGTVILTPGGTSVQQERFSSGDRLIAPAPIPKTAPVSTHS